MGIADEIRKNLQSKILIRYISEHERLQNIINCELCNCKIALEGNLCLYIKDDGFICKTCTERFAPEIAVLFNQIENKISFDNHVSRPTITLSIEEWKDVHKNLQILTKITADLAKGISRGIVEAPAGHIGLLHFAKDIVKPSQKEGESVKDYELRVKSFRINKLCENLKNETTSRVKILQDYFIKLGLPRLPDHESE